MDGSSSTSSFRVLRTRWVALALLLALAALEWGVEARYHEPSDLLARLQAFDARPPGAGQDVAVLGTCMGGWLRADPAQRAMGSDFRVYNLSATGAFTLDWYLIVKNHVLERPGVEIVVIPYDPPELQAAISTNPYESHFIDLARWTDLPLVIRTTTSSAEGALALILSKASLAYRYRAYLANRVWRGLGLVAPGVATGSVGSAAGVELGWRARAFWRHGEDPALACLDRLMAAAERRGAHVVFVPMPVRDAGDMEPDPAYVPRLQSAIQRYGAQVLDVRASVGLRRSDFQDDSHMTSAAADRFSAAVGMALARLAASWPVAPGRMARSRADRLTYEVPLPPALPRAVYNSYVPRDNPMSAAKVALGRKLFFDKNLSVNGKFNCVSCHDPRLGFADNSPLSDGFKGRLAPRNSQTVWNAMFDREQFWDGRVNGLEAQSLAPLVSPLAMAMPSQKAVIDRVKKSPEYVALFQKAFGGPPSTARLADAIACYERTLVSFDAPFDRFAAGDAHALSAAARRGWNLFKGKARCIACHSYSRSAPFFTDFKYYNVGVRMRPYARIARLARKAAGMARTARAVGKLANTSGYCELGRFLVTRQPRDVGAFRTPTLRDLTLTAPYMHDGGEKTLLDTVKYFDRGGTPNPHLDRRVVKLHLTPGEEADLVAFMRSLTGDRARRVAEGKEAP